MLLNAFLACGVRHLTLVNPAAYSEEKALNYYDKASRYLLRALQNPERDSVICATTAVILNVYEIMTEKALPRMNHIAGARALIKECGWDARSSGIGAACFWLNVGMELLSNLTSTGKLHGIQIIGDLTSTYRKKPKCAKKRSGHIASCTYVRK